MHPHPQAQHQRTSFGKRLRANLDHHNDQYLHGRGHHEENETSSRNLQVPVPLRVRSLDHNVDRASAPSNRRASIPSQSIFLPLRSPGENSEDEEDSKHQRLMFPMARQPDKWSLKMRARGMTYPMTKEYLQKASRPSPPCELDFETNLEGFESTVFGTPKQLAVVNSWSPPAPPVTCASDDVTLDDIPPSVLLPLFD